MKVRDLVRQLDAFVQPLLGLPVDGLYHVAKLADMMRPFNRFEYRNEIGAPTTGPEDFETKTALVLLERFIRIGEELGASARLRHLHFVKQLIASRLSMTIDEIGAEWTSEILPGAPLVSDGTFVDHYVKLLNAHMHDEAAFSQTFHAVSNDPRLSKDVVVQIACAFAYKMPKSTSKKDALDRIWRIHNASETFAAKAASRGGKSAA